jgi:tetratricopeptide (TPR) repeat protein
VLKAQIKNLGLEHDDTVKTQTTLALACIESGSLTGAIELLEQGRETKIRKLGADHPDAQFALKLLALTYEKANRPAEAIEVYQELTPTLH